MRLLLSVFVLGVAALPTWAVPLVDGTRDAEYGAAKAVQTVQTQFGDNFSEMDAGYAVCDDTHLYLMLTGNIEANFNKLEIFIDSTAGGQSVFTSAGNDNAGNMNGLVFDNGFTADYHVIARRGFAPGDGGNGKFDLDFAELGNGFSSYQDNILASSGFGVEGFGATGVGVNGLPILVGYDNSNTAGVTGGDQAADQTAAAAVTTGLELAIALSDLGYTGGPLKVMVGQNGGNHDFWSNQFLGGLAPPQGNLGGPGAKDFTALAGDQFFVACIPEPSTVALVGLALVGMLGLGRRRK